MKPVRFIAGALLTITGLAPLSAQTGTVRGHVTSSDGGPIAGATITVTGHRTLSSSDGSYVINGVAAGSDSVRARIIGYAPQAKAVTLQGGDTATVDFALTAQAVALAEVVVQGYGTQAAGDLTTATKQINDSQFNPGAVVSPQNLIENKVAGVQVIDNNDPGGGLSIRIRGASSVNASAEPLYVVDGVPLGTGSGGGLSGGRDPLNFLNPDDIASITILKDAAATAIYGANASNGVVLITTKTGTAPGTTQVQYGGSFSSSSITRVPSMLNAAQFKAAVNTYYPAKAGLLGNANTDWFPLISQTGTGMQQNVSLAGAGANNGYRLSFGYLKQNGVIQASSTERISLGLNYDQRLFNNFIDMQASLKGSRALDNYTPGGVLSNAAQMGPTQPVFDPTTPTGYANWVPLTLNSADNPVEILTTSLDHASTYRSIGNLKTHVDFSRWPALQGLTGTVNLAYDVTQVDHVSFFPNNIHAQTRNGNDGSYFRTQPYQLNELLEMYLDYQPPVSLGPGALDFTGGYSYSQSHADFPSVSANQLFTNLLADNGLPQTANPPVQADFIDDAKLISFFGRAGYNINDRYLASVSLRHDGSSRFAASHQWGDFPAVSLGWRISQEPFLSSVTAISDLKLRGSWGKTGNQSIGNYLGSSSFQPCDSKGEVQFGNDALGKPIFMCPFRPSAVDPNIQWESTTTWDFGADYSLLGSFLSGSVDYYSKHTDNLIFTVPVAAGSNLSNFVTTNIGTMSNKGFELDLTARLMDRPGLSWTVSANAAHNVNEILSVNPNVTAATQVLTGGIAGGVGSTIQVLEPGQPINSFFVCQQAYSSGKPVEGKYVPQVTGDTSTTCSLGHNTRAFHDPAPHWIFGLTNTMTYRHFDFSFTLRAWLGNYVYNNVGSNLGNYIQLSYGAPFNLQSSVLQTGFKTQQLLSDFYVEDGSFLRMDNIAVGYSFPFQGRQIRAYMVVQNAFTITGYSGVDPTSGLNGIDNNIYPRSRMFTGGLDVKF